MANGWFGAAEKIDRAQVLTNAQSMCLSDFGLLGHLQCIFNLDAQVTNRALQLGVAEKQLNRT